MITITVDPLIDTPAEMKKYADKFKVKPGWYFLTGKKEQMLTRSLTKSADTSEDKNQHVNLLMIGNVETGEWSKVFAMSKPSDIADVALKIAGPNKQ